MLLRSGPTSQPKSSPMSVPPIRSWMRNDRSIFREVGDIADTGRTGPSSLAETNASLTP